MKKIVALVLISLIAVGTIMAAGGADSAKGGSFPGKIAVVTSTLDQNEEEYRSAEQLVAKYGANKIVHVTWPSNFMAEQEQMVTILNNLAADFDIRALVINQAVPNTNASVDKFKETRDDVFIVYCQPQENPPDVSRRANLLFNNDQLAIAPLYVEQAQRMGARTIVHYSFPRHMSQPLLSGRRDLMRQRAAELGIQFVDATAPDPTGDAGVTGTQQFILEDIPRMINRYGTQTTFFGTNCAMQTPMLTRVFEGKALYAQPCCPSPYHAFPLALGIETPPVGQGLAPMDFVISETRRIAAANGMTGRLSNWPVPAGMMYTTVGVEYAIRWINGQVPKDGVDRNAVAQLMSQYIREMSGENITPSINAYVESGTTYPNYLLIQMGFLTY